MAEEKSVENFLMDEYGVSTESMSEDQKESWLKEHEASLVKINAAGHEIPSLMMQLENKEKYSDVYRVVYDRGIGQLQQSAKNEGLFRANVVKYGTNNKVVGQAELEKLQIDKVTQLSNAALVAFQIASIATNQYFLARIDKELTAIEESVDDIKRFLAEDKESELIAEYEYVTDVLQNENGIKQDPLYKQSVLAKLQDIQVDALHNMKFYTVLLDDAKEKLHLADNNHETNEKTKNLLKDFSYLWLSFNLYSLTRYAIIRFTEMTDQAYLDNVIDDILKKMDSYEKTYEKYYKYLDSYFENLNRYQRNKAYAVAGKLGQLLGNASFYTLIPGAIVKFGADYLDEKDKRDKDEKKRNDKKQTDKKLLPYADLSRIKLSAEAVMETKSLSCEKTEMLVDGDSIYLLLNTDSIKGRLDLQMVAMNKFGPKRDK